MIKHRVNRFNNRSNVRFGARPTDSDFARSGRELLIQMYGNHQDGYCRAKMDHLASDVKTIGIGHLKIQKHQIRLGFLQAVQGFFPRPRLAADLPRGLLFKDCAQVMPYGRIVIYDENSDQDTPSFPRDLSHREFSRPAFQSLFTLLTLDAADALNNAVKYLPSVTSIQLANMFRVGSYQTPLSLLVMPCFMAAAVANAGSRLKRREPLISPPESSVPNSVT